jgi:hypothetical protein
MPLAAVACCPILGHQSSSGSTILTLLYYWLALEPYSASSGLVEPMVFALLLYYLAILELPLALAASVD